MGLHVTKLKGIKAIERRCMIRSQRTHFSPKLFQVQQHAVIVNAFSPRPPLPPAEKAGCENEGDMSAPKAGDAYGAEGNTHGVEM